MLKGTSCFDQQDLYLFIVQEPLLAYCLMRSKIIEEKDAPFPAAVSIKNGIINLYLNPDKIKEMSTKERVGVLVHEFLHVLLLHCTKRSKPDASQRKKENIAMDMAINQLIVKNYDLPEYAVFHNKEPFDFPPDLTAEQYYELIDNSFSSEQVQCLDSLDDHNKWEEGETLEGRSVIKDLAEGYAQSKNANKLGKTLSAGSKYGDILEKLLTIEVNDIAWQTHVKKFMHNILDSKKLFTYKKFSRRHGFPAPGRKFKNKAKLAVIVDTSGSMSSTFLSHIGGQLNLMAKIMQVDVFWCDAQVQGEVKKYKPKKELEFPGRGGTDMQPAFDLAVAQNYKGIVCFTDGGLFKEPECGIPTLWVSINNKSFKPPFGKLINVEWRD